MDVREHTSVLGVSEARRVRLGRSRARLLRLVEAGKLDVSTSQSIKGGRLTNSAISAWMASLYQSGKGTPA